MGNGFKSKNSFLEGGTMSHPVNDEILENLYEEALEYVIKKNKYQYDSNQKELEDAAVLIAKQWFEERCQ